MTILGYEIHPAEPHAHPGETIYNHINRLQHEYLLKNGFRINTGMQLYIHPILFGVLKEYCKSFYKTNATDGGSVKILGMTVVEGYEMGLIIRHTLDMPENIVKHIYSPTVNHTSKPTQ